MLSSDLKLCGSVQNSEVIKKFQVFLWVCGCVLNLDILLWAKRVSILIGRQLVKIFRISIPIGHTGFFLTC